MPRCQEFKTDHTQCTRNATRVEGDTHPEHLHFCRQHKQTYANSIAQHTGRIHHTAGRCYHMTRPVARGAVGWIWCPSPAAEGQMMCPLHETERLDRVRIAEQRVNDRNNIRNILDALIDQQPPLPWRQAVRVLVEMVDEREDIRHAVALQYFNHHRTIQLEPAGDRLMGWTFRRYWNWAINGQVGPDPELAIDMAHAVLMAAAPPARADQLVRAPAAPAARAARAPAAPPRDLARLAGDNQNVHTQVVSEQTNKATEKLKAVKVPESQQTEKSLALVWIPALVGTKVSYGTFLQVSTDINKWFNTKDCRAKDDNLYRKLLRGLVALMNAEKDEERKSEMFRRCWEECQESVGMCCEGHIGRLCNVLVGFDEAFQPPVPFGEILQSKMAAIAGMDVSEEEKRKLATAFFDEHKTPEADRTAWLDAF